MHRTVKILFTVCALVLTMSVCGAALAYNTCVTRTVTGSYSFVSLGSLDLVATDAGQPAALSPDSAVSNDLKAVFTLPEGETLPVYIFAEVVPGNGALPALWNSETAAPRNYMAVRGETDRTPLITFSIDDRWQPVEGAPNVFCVETDKTDEIYLLKDQQIKAASGLTPADDITGPAYSLAFKAYAVGKAGFDSPKAAWDALKSQTEVSGK